MRSLDPQHTRIYSMQLKVTHGASVVTEIIITSIRTKHVHQSATRAILNMHIGQRDESGIKWTLIPTRATKYVVLLDYFSIVRPYGPQSVEIREICGKPTIRSVRLIEIVIRSVHRIRSRIPNPDKMISD